MRTITEKITSEQTNQTKNELCFPRLFFCFQAPDHLTKSVSTIPLHGHGYFDRKEFSVKQLSFVLSDLHIRDDNTIKITCMSTIPSYSSSLETYGDKRMSTTESKFYISLIPRMLLLVKAFY